MSDCIGIIMAAYNTERWIGEAVESILHQTYTDWILMIVDDGSTDDTLRIALDYSDADRRIEVLSQPHSGCPVAKARAVELLLADPEVEYIAIMDADDVCVHDRLQLELDYLRHETDVDIVRTSYDWVDEHGKFLKHMHPRPANATAMCQRRWYEQIKFDNTEWWETDGRWMKEAERRGATFGTIECELYSQRRHPQQISLRKRRQA